MSEQRLIDANAFKECWKPGVIGDTLRRVIDDQPTIDPETLPIVQELRAELERVTEERDAAVNDLETAMRFGEWDDLAGFLCGVCEGRGCAFGECKPKWRGVVAESATTSGPDGDHHD